MKDQSMGDQFVLSINCKCFHQRLEPSRHFVYEIHVKWSNGQSAVIYRRYSQFFNLQCKLLDTFPLEAGTYNPARRTIPFMPGKRILGNVSEKIAEKRRAKFDVYLNALIALPNVGCSALVLQFFESKESDLTFLLAKKSSSIKRNSFKGRNITGPISFPQCVVISNYKKSQNGEMSVAAGTLLFVIEKKHTGWWLAQTQDGEEQGWVPATYLDPVYSDIDSDEDELDTLPSEPERFVTTSAYTSQERDELSVGKACVVDVISKSMDGWWTCRYQGKTGVFPAAYLRKANTLKAKQLLELSRKPVGERPQHIAARLEDRELSHYAPPRRDYSRPKPPRPATAPVKKEPIYVAIGDFTNTMSDGIDLTEGAHVKILTKDDSGWWFVEVGGATGWAPSTYIQADTTRHRVQSSTAGISTASTSAANTSAASTSAAAASAAPVISKPKKPARPDLPPSAKTSPKTQTRSTNVGRRESPPISRPVESSVALNNSNTPRPDKGLPGRQPPVTNSTAQFNYAVKPNIPKKPSLAGAASHPISHSSDRSAESEVQLSVAELRKKLSLTMNS